MKRGWNGILIEPIPQLFDKIIKKNRKAYVINACIAHSKPMVAKFRVGDSLSGRDDAMDKKHKKRINKSYQNDQFVTVPCFSLNTIMKALEVSKVHMFSLDIEGGEYDVLKTIDFKKLNIDSFVIEHNGRREDLKRFRKLFDKIKFGNTKKMYSETKVDSQDVFFFKNS